MADNKSTLINKTEPTIKDKKVYEKGKNKKIPLKAK